MCPTSVYMANIQPDLGNVARGRRTYANASVLVIPLLRFPSHTRTVSTHPLGILQAKMKPNRSRSLKRGVHACATVCRMPSLVMRMICAGYIVCRASFSHLFYHCLFAVYVRPWISARSVRSKACIRYVPEFLSIRRCFNVFTAFELSAPRVHPLNLYIIALAGSVGDDLFVSFVFSFEVVYLPSGTHPPLPSFVWPLSPVCVSALTGLTMPTPIEIAHTYI